ncbi:MAG TPA: Rne/Rng family ribonuclease [Acidimicrobiales bacterium]|nr:Rne/Rng family ribonuclease [Acidimicrobiales bacterium]
MSEADVSGNSEAPNPVPEVPETPAAAPPRPAATTDGNGPAPGGAPGDGAAGEGGGDPARKRRRRGSRGGRKRSKPRAEGADATGDGDAPAGSRGAGAAAEPAPAEQGDGAAAGSGQGGRASGQGGGRGRGRGRTRSGSGTAAAEVTGDGDRNPELPDLPREGRPTSVEAATAALVPKAPPPKPKIGDTIPADVLAQMARKDDEAPAEGEGRKRRRRRGGRSRSGNKGGQNGGGTQTTTPVQAVISHDPTELDEETLERRRGRERKGRAVGRYSMCVHVTPRATQIAVLEGRSLIEHYVSHPSDDVSQIHGNVYLGRVQNVLPGMEAAFVDIGTPKNAVLYRGDVHYDPEDIERSSSGRPRIEDVLRAGQTILCQVTKNPIGAKGARLTQEVSLPGRFVVLIPNSSTYGISKRLPDDERKRLRTILDRVKPAQHGVIVRTAAENVTTDEIEDDVRRLLDQWGQIEALAKRSKAPALLYREPDMAVRVIREEFSQDYRSVLIDDRELYNSVRDYVASISPELADRVEFYDPEVEPLPLYERHHVHEQLHRALDRKVWLPSGGSLIVEHTEALTVIDVNTGKNVGRSSLEETVFKNNLEAAVEIARQLRLRDVGGIIVVDFIDMERKDNREEVVRVFRDALSRDKTRTQVFDISELGLCEMTRKRIGEGLLESFAGRCPDCDGRGVIIDKELLPD